MHLGYPELATSATPSSLMLQSTVILAAQVSPDFPKDNQTESQAVELAAFHSVEGLVDLHLPEPTPNLQLEHTVDHPRSVPRPCHLRLSDTTGSLLQAPAASASLSLPHHPFSDFFHCQRSWVHHSLASSHLANYPRNRAHRKTRRSHRILAHRCSGLHCRSREPSSPQLQLPWSQLARFSQS